MRKQKVANGIFWVDIPEADLRILCGCPEDTVKHLIRAGLIAGVQKDGVSYESGPNAILLSDTPIQKGQFANLAEFPLLQMLYRQGMLIPHHPGNTGRKPLLIGLGDQVRSQEQYFFRGNYGLRSCEELVAAGVEPDAAVQMMRVKTWFAFGSLLETADLVETRSLDNEATAIAPGVVVHRRGFNRYEFLSAGQSVEVDLTLAADETYAPAFSLPPAGARRATFSVIHAGEGDGWDTARQCMASIVCWQGRFYLIDAGPHITDSLDALGIGVAEVEGIFHTHMHDDHFAGLTSLVRAEKRIKYFAVPWVRATAQKKLAALMRFGDDAFGTFFEVHDLAAGQWNDVDGMSVRPLYSPHPVETTVFFFRVPDGSGTRTYAHLADIPSFDVLGKLAAAGPEGPALSASAHSEFIKELLTPADVKKIDAGGGMIHGDAADFVHDSSTKIIMSHGAAAAGVGFGDQDVLIAGSPEEYCRRAARASLAAWFPGVAGPERDALAAHQLVEVQSGELVHAPGDPDARLVLLGIAEESAFQGARVRRESGAFLGLPGDKRAGSSWRALSSVTALSIPAATLTDFLRHTGAAAELRGLEERQAVLALCPLFAGVRSATILRQVAGAVTERRQDSAATLPAEATPMLHVLAEGEVDLAVGSRLLETLHPGGFWAEERVTGLADSLYEARAAGPCTYYCIPAAAIAGIPFVQWTLMETFERRLRTFKSGFRFEWSPSFLVDVPELDDQHRKLFFLVNGLSELIAKSGTIAGHDEAKKELLEFTALHFQTEERVLARAQYARLETQAREHRGLVARLETFVRAGERRARPRAESMVDYLKDWLIRHTLLEDLKYKSFLSRTR
jgi:hemerythrin